MGERRRTAERPPRATQVEVWRTLMEVHAAVLADIAERLESEHGLSLSEFDALVHVTPRGVRHQELAESVILSRSALSRLVDRLAERGLVTRRPHPGDRRGVEIRLTREGAALRRAAARTNADVVVSGFSDHLTPQQHSELAAILDAVRDGQRRRHR